MSLIVKPDLKKQVVKLYLFTDLSIQQFLE